MRLPTHSMALRGFVVGGVGYFLVWQVAVAIGWQRGTTVPLALYGFVFHVVYGKAYALLPAYFDRELALPWVPWVHLPLALIGAGLLAEPPIEPLLPPAPIGAVAWSLGAGLFLIAIGVTLRDNLTGAETGTGSANASRVAVDRYANAFMPIAMGYLAVGAWETVALATALPPLLVGRTQQVAHLLGAGVGALLILAVGARLFPRFFVASPPRPVIYGMLPAAAIGPVLIAADLGGGLVFRIGGLLEGLAVLSYAGVIVVLFLRTDRTRVGFPAIVLGAASGVSAVLIGLGVAFDLLDPGASTIHQRIMLGGFLGLTIVGALFQFYPPGIGNVRAVSDRSGYVAIASIAGGLALEAVGWWTTPVLTWIGRGAGILGAGLVFYLIAALVLERGLR